MTKFIYEARNEKGQLVKGEIQAANEVVAEKLLVKNKLISTKVEAEESLKSVLSFLNGVSIKDKAKFARQLSTMISAGLPLVQSLNIILTQTRQPAFKAIISTIIRDVESGFSFSAAISKHPAAFDHVFVSIVRAGEATGKLDQVLSELADQLEKDSAFAARIKGAMAYPIFIISAMIGVAILMMIKVIPTIKGVFEESGAQLPMATQILMAMSDFTIHYWYLLILIIIGLIAGIKFGFATPQGKILWDKIQLKTPTISETVVSVLMSRLTRTLGLLTASGIPILEALQIVADVMSNQIYHRGLEEVRDQVERGIPMSVPLMKNHDFPVLFGQMVAVGEQTGQVDVMLGNLAKFYTEEAETRLKGITTLIEPVVMLILGVGVAFLIFAILVPIYNISSIGG